MRAKPKIRTTSGLSTPPASPTPTASPRSRQPPPIRGAGGTPRLRFSPWAWAKLLYLRDRGPTEIGGLGITPPDDLLYVEDVALVTQHTSRVSVVLDDAAVADLFDRLIDAGRRPAEFARIWIHTHPGTSAEPSPTDEATFTRVFGECDWCVMCILAEGGATTARLRFSVGPGADLALAVTVDYTRPFAGTDQAAWDQEYEACVFPLDPLTDLTLPLVPLPEGPSPEDLWFPWGPEDPGDWDDLRQFDPATDLPWSAVVARPAE